MTIHELTARDLQALLAGLEARVRAPGRLYLFGATSHLYIGRRARVARFDLASEGGDAVAAAVRDAAHAHGSPIGWERPGDVIPLPRGHAGHQIPRPATALARLTRGAGAITVRSAGHPLKEQQ